MTKNCVYLLIASDGFSIESSEYSTLAKAQDAMKAAYDAFTPNEFGDEFKEISFINDTDAQLYANGETVYTWTIVPVANKEPALRYALVNALDFAIESHDDPYELFTDILGISRQDLLDCNLLQYAYVFDHNGDAALETPASNFTKEQFEVFTKLAKTIGLTLKHLNDYIDFFVDEEGSEYSIAEGINEIIDNADEAILNRDELAIVRDYYAECYNSIFEEEE